MSTYGNRRHYLEPQDEWDETGYGSDDGYDAIKDANAEAGFAHDSNGGRRIARQRGWLRKVRREPVIKPKDRGDDDE